MEHSARWTDARLRLAAGVHRGFVTTYHGPKPVLGYEGWARVLAQSQCSTGNFSDTLICKQVGITPTPMPGL